MANDFKHKEPSKTEKVLYELMMAQQGMERAMWSNSSVIMAIAMIQGMDPEKIAEILVNQDPKMKEYGNKVNEAIKKLEEKKHGVEGVASAQLEGHDHSKQDHSHESGDKSVDLNKE